MTDVLVCNGAVIFFVLYTSLSNCLCLCLICLICLCPNAIGHILNILILTVLSP